MRLAGRWLAALLPCVVLLHGAHQVRAQQLALRTYSARDGLAHGRVSCFYQDRRGYLWFGTWEGLSRYDGHRFVNYGVADGLPNPFIACITEDAAGGLWVGTLGGGFARVREPLDGESRPFQAFEVATTPRANDVFELLFDRNGELWLGTGAGIYRGRIGPTGVATTLELALARPDVAGMLGTNGAPFFLGTGTFAEVRDGKLLVTAIDETGGHGPVGRVERDGDTVCVVRERAVLTAPLADPTALRALALPLHADERPTAILREAGSLWVGTDRGLLEQRAGTWRRYGIAQGLPDDWVTRLFVDADHGLWVATYRGGLVRIADRAVASFGAREGFTDCNVSRVVEATDGTLYASTGSGGIYQVHDDCVQRLLGAPNSDFDSVHMRVCCDARGDFWLGTARGLWMCPGPRLDLTRCRRVGVDEGLPEVDVCAEVRPTPTGELWFGGRDRGVYRRSVDGQWHKVLDLPGPDPTPCRVAAAAPDGSMLLATFDSLLRWRDGTCSEVALGSAAPLRPRCVFVDGSGQTWIGTRFQGVFVDRPAAAGGILHLTSQDGLAGDAVWSIAGDRRGRVFFGTARGVSCFENGVVRAFAGSDRLAGEIVQHLALDRRGRLWVATSGGLSRVDLEASTHGSSSPRVFLARIRVDGNALPMPCGGTARFTGLVLGPEQRHLDVELTGLDFQHQEPPRFQHRLVGIDAEWSAPMAGNTVQFANLAAGSYRFLVRAVDGAGRSSEVPAELVFEVQPPVWRRGWFLTLVLAATLTLAWLFHRTRLRAAIATERLRTQIATDLHDEVGAGLAQIAILSEVTRQRVEPGAAAQLGELAGLARSLREGMSDIVWALARDQGTLADLVLRMQELAGRLIEACGATVAFSAPPAAVLTPVRLSLDQRRQLWLWFKEALTNVARHAAARAVEIELAIAGGRLSLAVRDDGVGFDARAPREGNGLPSLRGRAQRLGGVLHVQSAPGTGTEVRLDLPLRPRPA